MRAMERGVDIVVATPGRLLDLIDSRHVRLDQITQLVLDEADRMLDMGFIHDVRKIIKLVPKARQTLMFSATMPNDIASLAADILHDPVRVEVARAGKAVDRIAQSVYFLPQGHKRAALAALLQDPAMSRVIVFARTKRGADRVARNLAVAKVNAHAIHGNKSQNARQDALEAFRAGRTRVLVATDIAARGIDIDDVSHVINYELPNVPESYVHRIGRTARAGSEGAAIALCAPDERPYLRDIERLTRQPIVDAGQVANIDAYMSLPEAKHNRDEDAPHFERWKARIEHGRRNNRGPAPSPHERAGEARGGGRPGERPASDRFRSERPRAAGDREGHPFDRDRRREGDRPARRDGETATPRPRAARDERPRGAAPRFDGERPARPNTDRAREGGRPWSNRSGNGHGDRKFDRSPDRGAAPRAHGDAAERRRDHGGGDRKAPWQGRDGGDRKPHWTRRDSSDRAHSSLERGERRPIAAGAPGAASTTVGATGDRPNAAYRTERPDRDGRPFERRGEHRGERRDGPRGETTPGQGGGERPHGQGRPPFRGDRENRRPFVQKGERTGGPGSERPLHRGDRDGRPPRDSGGGRSGEARGPNAWQQRGERPVREPRNEQSRDGQSSRGGHTGSGRQGWKPRQRTHAGDAPKPPAKASEPS
jgi:ATP-dependent RNA helicase RhlE